MKPETVIEILRTATIEHLHALKDVTTILSNGGSKEAACERLVTALNLLFRAHWQTMSEEQKEQCREEGVVIGDELAM